jgi:5-methylcytosine-specific restriction protein A
MPDRIPNVCATPGCPGRTFERYCAACKPYNQPRRDPRTSARYGRHWRKVRAVYLSKHPLCELCQQAGKLVPATEVHHKIAIADGGTDADDNLQALCKPCHSRITLASPKVY